MIPNKNKLVEYFNEVSEKHGDWDDLIEYMYKFFIHGDMICKKEQQINDKFNIKIDDDVF